MRDNAMDKVSRAERVGSGEVFFESLTNLSDLVLGGKSALLRSCAYLSVMLLILHVCLIAQAQSFAALTVSPTGTQVFDISTGITTLPEGGTILDKEANLRLVAASIRYAEGGFIQASQVTVEGRFGNLQAEDLYVDITAQTIQATGSLSLAYQALDLTGERLTIYIQADVMVLEAAVSGQPQFTGQMLIVQLERQQAFLVAPYSFQDGLVTLRQSSAGQLLQLSQQEVQGSVRYAASTTIQGDLLAELLAYLPEE